MHRLNWIEIPATDHDRAIAFYSTLLDTNIQKGETLGVPYSLLPDEVGAIVTSNHAQPAINGVTVYIHLGDDMSQALSKVEAAGGKIIVPKTPLGEEQYFAIIHDTEGNRIGLHANN